MTQILEFPPGYWTLLPIIERCDNGNLSGDVGGTAKRSEERLVPFFVEETAKQPIGYLRPAVVQALLQDNVDRLSKSAFYEICWKMIRSDGSDNDTSVMDAPDVIGVAFREWIKIAGTDARTKHMNREELRERSATKPTWPGYLDNSAAGAISAGVKPTDSIVREAEEEASLPEAFVRSNVRAAGALSFNYRVSSGFVRPETAYMFDLQMPVPPGFSPEGGLLIASSDEQAVDSGGHAQDAREGDEPVVLKPNDGEVESFILMSANEVLLRLLDGKFKYNSAAVLVDFFIRHGLITPESEPNYLEIIRRTRRGSYRS